MEGFKGCMGLFLSRAVPVLFHHYSVFKRHEVCAPCAGAAPGADWAPACCVCLLCVRACVCVLERVC